MMALKMRIVGIVLLLISGALAAETESPSLFVVHFETGPAWDASLPAVEQSGFREHSANLGRLRKEGVIVFGARYDQLGMVFLSADSLDAAREIMDADPGVQAEIFIYSISSLNVFYPWQE